MIDWISSPCDFKCCILHSGSGYINITQVGVKMEARQNLARLGMFYGNKTTIPLVGTFLLFMHVMLYVVLCLQTQFTPTVQLPGDLATQLVVQAKPVDSLVDSGAQVQQLINVECLMDFYKMPQMTIKFV